MTPYQSPPWRKLTELSGGKGVKAEWQDFPAELLKITNEQASAIPCNSRAGCYMNVVRHGPSNIVGICTSDIKQCDRRTLKKSELALHRIDHKKLATKTAEAIGFTEQHEKMTDTPPAASPGIYAGDRAINILRRADSALKPVKGHRAKRPDEAGTSRKKSRMTGVSGTSVFQGGEQSPYQCCLQQNSKNPAH